MTTSHNTCSTRSTSSTQWMIPYRSIARVPCSLPTKMYQAETYRRISETAVLKKKHITDLGAKNVSFEFRSENSGRQIFIYQVCWEWVPCGRPRDRKPTRAEGLSERPLKNEITTSRRAMRPQRIAAWNDRKHLREVWRSFTTQAAV